MTGASNIPIKKRLWRSITEITVLPPENYLLFLLKVSSFCFDRMFKWKNEWKTKYKSYSITLHTLSLLCVCNINIQKASLYLNKS